MNYKYYILKWGSMPDERNDYGILMWDDIKEQKNCELINVKPQYRNDEFRAFHSMYCKNRYMRYFFYRLYLGNKRISGKSKKVFLINDVHPCLKNLEFVDYLKKKYDAIVILYFLNQVQNKLHPAAYGVPLEILENYFDYIITDDYEDSKRYGLYYISDPYSITQKDDLSTMLDTDLYYSGWDKNRSKIIHDLAELFDKKNISYQFKLVKKEKQCFESVKISYVGWRAYHEIINEVDKTNCILELIEENQTATTLRYLEAICYNKKLLTNNVNIVNYPFYNPQYMKIFRTPSDIDIDFIRERVNVDYGYDGCFSPLKYIENVEKIIRRK